jgi:hypothetical protein
MLFLKILWEQRMAMRRALARNEIGSRDVSQFPDTASASRAEAAPQARARMQIAWVKNRTYILDKSNLIP